MLQPPRRQGRVAVYDETHLDRLRLIALLQERGLRLSAIADLVAGGDPTTLSMSAWLGLGDRLATSWQEEAPARLAGPELTGRLEGTGLDTAALAELGLALREKGGGWTVPSPGLLDVTLALARAGVDPATAAAAAGILRRHLGDAAEELVDHFVEHVGRGFGGRGAPHELAGSAEALRTLSGEAVRIIFAQEMQRRLARFAEPPQEARARSPRR